MKKYSEEEIKEFEKYISIYNIVKEGVEKGEAGNREVIKSFLNDENSKSIIEKLSSNEETKNITDILQSAQDNADVNRLYNTINKIERRRRSRKITAVIASAAAALIAISFYLLKENVNDTIISGKPDIKGIEKITKPSLVIENNVIPLKLTEATVKISEISETAKQISEAAENISLTQRVVVPNGYTYEIELSDGTNVLLNACSELTYKTDYNKGEAREVQLSGEAYFTVTPSNKPFIVKAGDSYVKVYGTQFNVNIKSKYEINTLLIEGSVGVGCGGMEEMKIHPNQLATINTKTLTQTITDVSCDEYLGWKNGYFKYIETDLTVMLEEVAKWYGVSFNYKNQYNGKINLSIRRNMKIDEVLEYVSRVTELEFINEGGGIYSIK